MLGANGPDHSRGLFADHSAALGFGGALNFCHGGMAGVKPLDFKPFATSSALTAADLQFSGYILNGGHDAAGRTDPAHRGVAGDFAAQFDGSSYLHDAPGAGDTRPLAALALGKRGGSMFSHSHLGALGVSAAPGAQALSVSSTPYHAFPPVGTMPMAEYSSYASLLNKASLMFDSNLDSMIIDWSLEERECRRRLVQFWRRHENNNILCTFKAVAAADRVPNSIVVSCIFWEERQDFFITSVDCIHLLESLIAVRFTVEEKNRIRRNLEGFRPLTVSKCKAESAEFFKLIMSFPNPKPRNIEKDVKVFPWRVLPLALKKIIGKYTASYRSAASASMDSLPGSRAAAGGRMAGVPLSAPGGGGSGGGVAFTAHAMSARADVLDVLQATGGAQLSTPSPASRSSSLASSLASSSASLAAMLEVQRARAAARHDADSIAASAVHGAGLQPGAGLYLGLDMGPDFSAVVAGDKGRPRHPASTAASFAAVACPAPLGTSMAGPMMVPASGNQLCLAGMVMDGPASHPTASLLDQLAASYGCPTLGCELPLTDGATADTTQAAQSQQQPRARVARGPSARRAAQRAPYTVDRSERAKAGSTSSSSNSDSSAPAEPSGSPATPLLPDQQFLRDAVATPCLSSLLDLDGACPSPTVTAALDGAPAPGGRAAGKGDVAAAADEALGLMVGDGMAPADYMFLADLIRSAAGQDDGSATATPEGAGDSDGGGGRSGDAGLKADHACYGPTEMDGLASPLMFTTMLFGGGGDDDDTMAGFPLGAGHRR
ncbi:hypothetical protein H4R19_003486 [Coemansia spiralis]|nr:hypothetical protein H4R19_003486 [Coemansia spiralis]